MEKKIKECECCKKLTTEELIYSADMNCYICNDCEWGYIVAETKAEASHP